MTHTLLDKAQIYAHRGLWKTKSEQNSTEAIQRAFEAGFSVETDIVTVDGQTKLSHDLVRLAEKPDFSPSVIAGSLAINIKADDAWEPLIELQVEIQSSGSFFFDGSTPTMKKVHDAGLAFANRVSEFESASSLPASYLWVDSFLGRPWWDLSQIQTWGQTYSKVIFVSPELHGKEPNKFWTALLDLTLDTALDNLCICTDFPELFYHLAKDKG